jgi:hypothetical protein
VWTVRSWIRSVVLITSSAALACALAVPALGLPHDPPPPGPPSDEALAKLHSLLGRLRDDLADLFAGLQLPPAVGDRLAGVVDGLHTATEMAADLQPRDADTGNVAPDLGQPRTPYEQAVEDKRAKLAEELEALRAAQRGESPDGHSVEYHAWMVKTAAAEFIEQAPDATDKASGHEAIREAEQAEQAEQAENAAPADRDAEPPAPAAEAQPAPADGGDQAQNRADLGLAGDTTVAWPDDTAVTDDSDTQGQHGQRPWVDDTIVEQPGSVVAVPGWVVGEQQQEADGTSATSLGELFTTTPNVAPDREILLPPPFTGPGQEILLPPPVQGPDREILLPPELDLGPDILRQPDVDLGPDIFLPPHDLPGVTDRSALAG